MTRRQRASPSTPATLGDQRGRGAARSAAPTDFRFVPWPYVPTPQEIAAWILQVEAAARIPSRQRVEGDGRDAGGAGLFARALAMPELPFPALGEHAAPGWRLVEEYAVDVTGLAAEDGPVMTMPALLREVSRHAGQGWAVRAIASTHVLFGRYERLARGPSTRRTAPETSCVLSVPPAAA